MARNAAPDIVEAIGAYVKAGLDLTAALMRAGATPEDIRRVSMGAIALLHGERPSQPRDRIPTTPDSDPSGLK